MALLAQKAIPRVHQSRADYQAELEQTQSDEAEGETLQTESESPLQKAQTNVQLSPQNVPQRVPRQCLQLNLKIHRILQ